MAIGGGERLHTGLLVREPEKRTVWKGNIKMYLKYLEKF
jgi:hypothetical protein